MRLIVGLSVFLLMTAILILSSNQANALCCFPYDMNYYIDPMTGDFVLNGDLINDSYLGEPFGNTSYRFVFLDKGNNVILEKNILLTDILPIKGGVIIPFIATFPFQVVLGDLDSETIQQISNFRVDGTNTLDYFGWKPADLAIFSDEITNAGTIHGKNGDVFTKWKIGGNVTNINSEKTENVYVVASLRDKNDGMVGVAGYSDDSVQPVSLNGFETKRFVLYALVPASKTTSKVSLYAESDDSSMIFPYYKPIIMEGATNREELNTADPKKPIVISANLTNISRENLDFNWIIQIKKSPKSVSEGDATEYPESRIVFVKTIPGHIDAQKSTKLEYSWTPQSNGVYFYEMYIWDKPNAAALSHPFVRSFLSDNWLIVNSNLNSVTNQIKSGISLDAVQCREGLEIAHEASNGNLVCIKPETKIELTERGWIRSTTTKNTSDSKYAEIDVVKKLLSQNQIEYIPDKIIVASGPSLFDGDPRCGAVIDVNSVTHWFGVDSISKPQKMKIFSENPNPCKVNTGSCFCDAQMELTALTLDDLSYFSSEEEEKVANTLVGYLDKENINRTPKFLIGKFNLNYTDPTAIGYCGELWGYNKNDYFGGVIVNDQVADYGLKSDLSPLCAMSENAKWWEKK